MPICSSWPAFKRTGVIAFTALAIVAFLGCHGLFAQGQLWGVTPFGGPAGAGVIFRTNGAGTGYTVQQNFNIETGGATPFYSQLTEAPNGKLYGMTGYGGTNNAGVLYEFDPATGNYATQLDFGPASMGAGPSGGLVTASNGKLYGMTPFGGSCNSGVLFEYDPSTGSFVKKLDFCISNGANPYGSLVMTGSGKLFGMATSGGANGYGALFEFDPANGNFNIRVDFDFAITGAYPYGNLIQGTDGKLYGMTGSGGANGTGVLFEFDPSNGNCTNKLDFESVANGSSPYGSLTQADNGKLYGMTFQGGANSTGVLFEYDPSNGNYVKKHDFGAGDDGALPYGNSLTKAFNGKLYGMTTNGGVHGKGILFEYDPVADNYLKKLDFEFNTSGSIPYGSLLQASNGKLYGVTSEGGFNGLGLLFEYELSTGGFVKKVDFGSSANGAAPQGTLVKGVNGKLYGTTSHGGVNGKGVLFEYTRVPGNYVKKFDFSLATGSYPLGKLTQATNGNLYGMTSQGGDNNLGVLFEYNPSNGNYSKKLDFDNALNGAFPHDNGLTEVSGKLYGAVEGGANGSGVLFEFDPSNGNSTVKLVFESVANGDKPVGDLVQAPNGKLYGMTHDGGLNSLGVLYEYDPATGTYVKLVDFDFDTGVYPLGSLVLAANGKLYGATSNGGINFTGTMFEFDPSTAVFTKKLDFPPSGSINGDWPLRGLTLSPNGKLYGSTTYGGVNGFGALFEFDPATSNLLKKFDFAQSDGSNPSNAALLLIDLLDQTITFNPLSTKTFGTAPFSLNASSDSGLPITYLSSDPTVASIVGNTVTILKAGTAIITASQEGDSDYDPALDVQQTLTVVKATPVVTWANPADIIFSTALGATQLNATADVAGTFTYNPPSGTVLDVGPNQTLSVDFTPADAVNYEPVLNKQVMININKVTPAVTWTNPANIAYGTALSSAQLNATASVGGAFTYSPDVGTVLNAGANQILSVDFTPFDPVYYNSVNNTQVQITVDIAVPVVTWTDPVPITYGTSLNGVQLNATASVPGTFVYNPASGTVPNAGANQTLSVNFIPSDAVNYSSVSNTQVHITVNKATPVVTWANPADIAFGTSLGSAQLNATSSVPGTFTYVPNAGTVLSTGANQILTVNFAPTDAANYNAVSNQQTLINVIKALPIVTWSNPADITLGTPLGAAQLNATANVAGTFTYTPASGTILTLGLNQTLSANFAPADVLNYNPVNNVVVQINVNKGIQTITFDALPTKTLGDAPFPLTAISSSGLPVTFSSSSDKLTMSGNVVTLAKAGRATITADQAGDDSFLPAPSVDQNFCINPVKPVITISNASALTATLVSNASNGNQWYLNGTAITGAINSTLLITASGAYAVQVKEDDCESAFSEEMPFVVTGDISFSSGAVKVFPNPVEGYLEIGGLKGEVTDSQLMDATGRHTTLVLEKKPEGYGTAVHQLPQGIYFLRVQAGSSVHLLKFIKK